MALNIIFLQLTRQALMIKKTTISYKDIDQDQAFTHQTIKKKARYLAITGFLDCIAAAK